MSKKHKNAIYSKSPNGQLLKLWGMNVFINTFQKSHFPPLEDLFSYEPSSLPMCSVAICLGLDNFISCQEHPREVWTMRGCAGRKKTVSFHSWKPIYYIITISGLLHSCTLDQMQWCLISGNSLAGSPVAELPPPGEELVKVLAGEALVVLHVVVTNVQVHL